MLYFLCILVSSVLSFLEMKRLKNNKRWSKVETQSWMNYQSRWIFNNQYIANPPAISPMNES